MSKPYILKTVEDLRHESEEIARLIKNQWVDMETSTILIQHLIDTAYSCGKADQSKEHLDKFIIATNEKQPWKESS